MASSVCFSTSRRREDQAVKAAEFVDFVEVGVLPDHTKDLNGHPRDVILMEMPCASGPSGGPSSGGSTGILLSQDAPSCEDRSKIPGRVMTSA